MPLALPDLDDRAYADLVEEARKLIPTLAPQWTNHNPSDPGIMLVELFAYLTEMLIYRLNRVPHSHLVMFMKLLTGEEWTPTFGITLDDYIRKTIQQLRHDNRAVTAADYESLAMEAAPEVARAHSVPGRDLEFDSIQTEKPNHVSVIIVPRDQQTRPAPTTELKEAVREKLEPVRLLTTRLHVVGPRYVDVTLRLSLAPRADVLVETADAAAQAALKHYFDPLEGGPSGTGWPFGRSLYFSEIYQQVDKLPEVDYIAVISGEVADVLFSALSDDRQIVNDDGTLMGVRLADDELVWITYEALPAPAPE